MAPAFLVIHPDPFLTFLLSEPQSCHETGCPYGLCVCTRVPVNYRVDRVMNLFPGAEDTLLWGFGPGTRERIRTGVQNPDSHQAGDPSKLRHLVSFRDTSSYLPPDFEEHEMYMVHVKGLCEQKCFFFLIFPPSFLPRNTQEPLLCEVQYCD